MSRFDPFPLNANIRGVVKLPTKWFAFSVAREVWEGPQLCVEPQRLTLVPGMLDQYERHVRDCEERTKQLRDEFIRNQITPMVLHDVQIEWGLDEL